MKHETTLDLQEEKLKVLGTIQHRIQQQYERGKIKTAEGMMRCINDQFYFMKQEISKGL